MVSRNASVRAAKTVKGPDRALFGLEKAVPMSGICCSRVDGLEASCAKGGCSDIAGMLEQQSVGIL